MHTVALLGASTTASEKILSSPKHDDQVVRRPHICRRATHKLGRRPYFTFLPGPVPAKAGKFLSHIFTAPNQFRLAALVIFNIGHCRSGTA